MKLPHQLDQAANMTSCGTENAMLADQSSSPALTGSSPQSPPAQSNEGSRIAWSVFSLLGWCLLLWGVFYLLWRLAPEVTPGSVRVYDAKLAALKEPGLFAKATKRQVLVVGWSYTMTGFKPQSFDRLSGATCSSFNLGLPRTIFGRRVYSLPEILAMLEASGQYPTDVLVTWREPWPLRKAAPKRSFWRWFTPDCNSAAVVETLFPFRQLVRDGTIFLLRSLEHGGPRAFKHACSEELQSVMRSRGYYFIKTDSIYPNDQLPEHYSARTDSPGQSLDRPIAAWEEFVRSFRQAAPRARLILVPNYYRENSCAPAPSNQLLREVLGKYGVVVTGPDYFQYPNRFFSDAAHLNPAGAEVYTRDLWNLLRD